MDDLEQVAAVGWQSTGITIRDSFSAYSAALALSLGLLIEYKCETRAIFL
jgi:hypothetical protein